MSVTNRQNNIHIVGSSMHNVNVETSRIKMLGRIISGDKEKWKPLPLQYLKVLDKKCGVEMFVLKVTKSEDEPEFN